MKIEGLLFALLAVFFVVVSGVYWALSHDPTGFTCLILTGGLAFIIGYYLLFTARRLEARPEDRLDAEISEGSGEMGFSARTLGGHWRPRPRSVSRPWAWYSAGS